MVELSGLVELTGADCLLQCITLNIWKKIHKRKVKLFFSVMKIVVFWRSNCATSGYERRSTCGSVCDVWTGIYTCQKSCCTYISQLHSLFTAFKIDYFCVLNWCRKTKSNQLCLINNSFAHITLKQKQIHVHVKIVASKFEMNFVLNLEI